MSFYGKIINYVTNAFAKINGQETEAGNELEFTGDNNLQVEVDSITNKNKETVIQVNYSHLPAARNNISVEKEGNIIQLQIPAFDAYGHANGELATIQFLEVADDGNGNISIKLPT